MPKQKMIRDEAEEMLDEDEVEFFDEEAKEMIEQYVEDGLLKEVAPGSYEVTEQGWRELDIDDPIFRVLIDAQIRFMIWVGELAESYVLDPKTGQHKRVISVTELGLRRCKEKLN